MLILITRVAILWVKFWKNKDNKIEAKKMAHIHRQTKFRHGKRVHRTTEGCVGTNLHMQSNLTFLPFLNGQ